MQAFSYTLSPLLKADLEKIELHRQQTYLILRSPSEEQELVWEALIKRIQLSLRFTNKQKNLREIERTLEQYGARSLTSDGQAILNTRNAYFFIFQNWRISEEAVDAETLKKLESLLFGQRSKLSEDTLKTALSFVQVSSDHPVIQAGNLFILILTLMGVTPEGLRFGSVAAYLILSKYGYDFKQYFLFEEVIYTNLVKFHQLIQQSISTSNLSEFLDFFTFSIEVATKNIVMRLSERKTVVRDHPALELTQRQKDILAYLEKPGLSITNRDVQKMFTISQITASRDLSGLVTVGMITSHGKGRSIYYTKV